MGFKPDLDDQLVSFSALTVGLVIWPVKIVPEMTYNVLSGTLSLYTLTHSLTFIIIDCSIRYIYFHTGSKCQYHLDHMIHDTSLDTGDSHHVGPGSLNKLCTQCYLLHFNKSVICSTCIAVSWLFSWWVLSLSFPCILSSAAACLPDSSRMEMMSTV